MVAGAVGKWAFAADEGVAAPIVCHITTILTKEDSCEKEVARAWALAISKTSKSLCAMAQPSP